MFPTCTSILLPFIVVVVFSPLTKHQGCAVQHICNTFSARCSLHFLLTVGSCGNTATTRPLSFPPKHDQKCLQSFIYCYKINSQLHKITSSYRFLCPNYCLRVNSEIYRRVKMVNSLIGQWLQLANAT